MRLRSTGLGDNKELVGHLTDLSPVGRDLLVFHIQTTEPVEWQLKAAMQFTDIPKLLRAVTRPSVLMLVLRSLFYVKKNPQEPEEF